jgi:Fe-S cluster assembly ATP-binding protein
MARNLQLAIYDEPEAGIDLWSFNMLVESFKGIAKRRNESMIIISHQERIMKIADEIAIIANGVVKKIGPTDEVFPELMSEFDNTCTFR